MSVLSPVIGFVIHKFIHFNQKRHVSIESWNLLARIIGTEVEMAINTQANMSGTARNINVAKNCYKTKQKQKATVKITSSSVCVAQDSG